MSFDEDAPLGQQFKNNPYEYFQNYVRNMNNEIFLSQYQINNLYALLLIYRGSPWDNLSTANLNYKSEVNILIEKRIKDVKFLLDNLSQLYEDKVKKSTFNQIQRLMSIIKAKNKSIFIQKCHQGDEHFEADKQAIKPENKQTEQILFSFDDKLTEKPETEEEIKKNQEKTQEKLKNLPDGLQVFGLISGLGNLPNLSAVALGNCLQYNPIQRFIKFKMTRNYIMTIKNDDSFNHDTTSLVSRVPSSLFIHHIFPYLRAEELFRARGVCKQWLGLVRDSWHSTFKRQMYIQLLAAQFCKDIEFFYKCIQLRNPFFHKLSLLLHALIQIIQWPLVNQSVQQNRINAPCKKVLIILLKLLGQKIQINHFNDLTEQLWLQHKAKVLNLKDRAVQFFSNFTGNCMSITELRALKTNILDHPFMRSDQMQTQEKTPLLLLIFIKELTLQQILKNHLHFSQQYLLNSKNRLDQISSKMPQHRGFLEGVYKVLLMRPNSGKDEEQIQDSKQMPSFHQMVQAIFENKQTDKPDFYIRTKSSKTSIYMDRGTKLDIILSIVRKTYGDKCQHHKEQEESPIKQMRQNEGEEQIKQNQTIEQKEQKAQKMQMSQEKMKQGADERIYQNDKQVQ